MLFELQLKNWILPPLLDIFEQIEHDSLKFNFKINKVNKNWESKPFKH
jgi:hypothetical protein